MFVQDCAAGSGWRSETLDGGAPDRLHFRLCGDACELVSARSDLKVEGIAVCKE
jgi:hypothetical protein